MDLQLPERQRPDPHSFNTDPEVLKAWVDDLPLINTGKTRALLAEALTGINALQLPAATRTDTLELLATSVMCVSESLKKTFLGKPLPLQGSNLTHASQAIDLCNQMATGYRVLVEDIASHATGTPQLAIAIHRSLRYLSEVLLTNYQIYIQYPESLWKIINTLYSQAEQYKVTTQVLTDTTLPAPGPSTINTVYKQLLLLSLACPYRLHQKEIHYVYNALLEWADNSQLYHIDSADARGQFAVNLQSDNAPSYRTLQGEDNPGSHWRILDCDTMEDLMRKTLAMKQDSTTTHAGTGIGDADTMQKLMLAWGVMPKRKFTRHPGETAIRLVIGLKEIHQQSTAPVPTEPDEAIGDQQYLQDPTFDHTTSIRAGDKKALDGARLSDTGPAARIEEWKIADTSAGGYCLQWDSAEASSARVGELVAIVEQGIATPEKWQLAAIRWMKISARQGLLLGIQLLSPGARAVWATVCKDDVSTGHRMQGILLPEIRPLGQPASLLLPSLPYRIGCISSLDHGGRTENIILTRLLENTGSFAQYHYSPAEADPGAG